jgi:DNA-binding NarL/FixJ family response regulator
LGGERRDGLMKQGDIRIHNGGLNDNRGKSARQKGMAEAPLNFDVQSYQFADLDLKIAVSQLPRRDQNILVLHLMGHKQADIGRRFNVSRSMISKRLKGIYGKLARWLK